MRRKKQKSKVSKIIEYVLSILCLVMCLYITIEVISATTSHRPPSLFGLSVSYVPTSSMEPTISADSYVLFRSADFNEIDVSDIIIFKDNDGRFIIHRVIEEYEGHFITKGDNNPIADKDQVTPDMVYGKYIMTLGFMSIFSGGISQNLIFFILVIIFVIMIIMQIFSIFIKAKTEEVQKKIEEDKEKLREELKLEILKEEIEKLKQERMKLNNKDEEE